MASAAGSGARRRRPTVSPGAPRAAVAPAWAQGGETLTTAGGPGGRHRQHPPGRRAGPTLLEDFHLREKIMHFDHERIPERVVHARGAGAHGRSRLTESLDDVTCARVLSDTGVETPVFVRFSTVAGSRGSADTARDVRGFAVKFYTERGQLGPGRQQHPGVLHPGRDQVPRRHPRRQARARPRDPPGRKPPTTRSGTSCRSTPESTHMLMWVMSDRAIPRSFRTMEGFGVHTFRLVNAAGATTLVKFHWKPAAGIALAGVGGVAEARRHRPRLPPP